MKNTETQSKSGLEPALTSEVSVLPILAIGVKRGREAYEKDQKRAGLLVPQTAHAC